MEIEMPEPTVAWLSAYGHPDSGVDHLGMRVAGEGVYPKMIDYVTTVSWRPRYFSFLCWATERAWQKRHIINEDGRRRIRWSEWARQVKLYDFLLAAASVAYDQDSSRISGSNKISELLKALPNHEVKLAIEGNHLRASTGSLSVYAGPMRAMGLLVNDQSIDRPSDAGQELAVAFQASLGDIDPDELIASGASLRQLSELGERCGLASFGSAAERYSAVRQERDLLREHTLAWNRFEGGFGPSAKRVLTIGFLLEIQRSFGYRVHPGEFRHAALLQAIRVEDGRLRLALPAAYELVTVPWATYQAHAYATYALESLLGCILSAAWALGDGPGTAISRAGLTAYLLEMVESGDVAAELEIIEPLAGWWNGPLSAAVETLSTVVGQQTTAAIVETELVEVIQEITRKGRSTDPERWVAVSCLLFLLSVVRLDHLIDEHGSEAWIGGNEHQRLVPERLLTHLQQGQEDELNVQQYLERVLNEFVVQQHIGNALRKLTAMPNRDSSKLHSEGASIVVLSTHQPGTSNPRFENAGEYLRDLGYLSDDGIPTDDGLALLDAIQGASA